MQKTKNNPFVPWLRALLLGLCIVSLSACGSGGSGGKKGGGGSGGGDIVVPPGDSGGGDTGGGDTGGGDSGGGDSGGGDSGGGDSGGGDSGGGDTGGGDSGGGDSGGGDSGGGDSGGGDTGGGDTGGGDSGGGTPTPPEGNDDPSLFERTLLNSNAGADAVFLESSSKINVSVDMQGNALAVWSDQARFKCGYSYNKCSSGRVWASHYRVGTGWETPVLLTEMQRVTNLNSRAINPHLATDNEGNAIAVWGQVQTDPGLWASRYTNATGWEDPVLVKSVYASGVGHRVAITYGVAHVVWGEMVGGQFRILSRSHMLAEPWTDWDSQELAEISAGGISDNFQLEIAGDLNGNVIAVWRQLDKTVATGGKARIWASRYVIGAGWSTPDLLSDNDLNSNAFRFASDDNGNALIVWTYADESTQGTFARRYNANSGMWSDTEIVHSSNTNGAALTLDNTGTAVYVSVVTDKGNGNIYASSYIPGTGWSEPAALDDRGHHQKITMTSDGLGNTTVMWQRSSYSVADRKILLRNYIPGAGWGPAQTIISNNKTADETHHSSIARNIYGDLFWVFGSTGLNGTFIYGQRLQP